MILIAGATGPVGGRVARGLLAEGKEVRILIRHNSPSEALVPQGRAVSASSLIAAGAEAVYGDLKDRASLDAAVQGVETVVTSASAMGRSGDDSVESVDINGTLNLIDAARKAGVRRFIYTSALMADPGSPSPLFRAKGICEKALLESGMEYTILEPAAFLDLWVGYLIGIPLKAEQPVTLYGKGDLRQSFAVAADVAAFEIAAVDNPKAANQCLVIGSLAPYSWNEIVAAAGRVLGRELPVQYIPLGSQLPLLPPRASTNLSLYESKEVLIDMSEITATYGVRLTTLGEFMQRTFAPK